MADFRYELLVNVKSRKGRESLDRIVKECHKVDISLSRINAVKDPTKLHHTLRAIKKRSPDVLIVGSGDGTVSEAVDFLTGTAITLAFVPLGTTNNFARSLNIPLNLSTAVARIKHGKTKNIDLGQVNDDYFANVAGIGLSGQVAASVTSKMKKKYGRLAYAISGIKVLLNHKPFFVEIADKDNELQLHFETHQLIVANGRFHAGKQIAAGARLDSRELVIFKLGGPSRLNFLWHMFDYYFGPRRTVYHSSYLIAKDIRVSTSSPQPVELDGEVRAKTPITATVHPRAVKVIC